jgi:hypothetical protein
MLHTLEAAKRRPGVLARAREIFPKNPAEFGPFRGSRRAKRRAVGRGLPARQAMGSQEIHVTQEILGRARR